MKKLIIFTFLLSFTIVSAQKKANKLDDDSVTPLKSACACIEKIRINQKIETRLAEVESCIESAAMAKQMESILNSVLENSGVKLDSLGQDKNTKVDSLIENGDFNLVVVPGLGKEELERELLENCSRLKVLIDNVEKSSNSISDNPKALDYYNQGLDVYEKENWKKALSFFEKALKEDTNFPFAWDMKGITHRKMGDYKEAIKAYKKSLKLDPMGKMPLQNIALAYRYLEDYESAAKAYEDLLIKYPGDPEAYYGLGQCGINLKDMPMAIDNMMIAYTLYIKIGSPYKQDAVKILSVLYNEMKDKGQLETFLSYARKHDIKFTD